MPRPDLKPGDLCVVETANNPLNNGKIVQLIRLVGYVPGWRGSDRRHSCRRRSDRSLGDDR